MCSGKAEEEKVQNTNYIYNMNIPQIKQLIALNVSDDTIKDDGLNTLQTMYFPIPHVPHCAYL